MRPSDARVCETQTLALLKWWLPEVPMISVRRFGKREDGQDLLEYGLLASLIAIFAIAAIRLVASSIVDVFWGQIANIQLF